MVSRDKSPLRSDSRNLSNSWIAPFQLVRSRPPGRFFAISIPSILIVKYLSVCEITISPSAYAAAISNSLALSDSSKLHSHQLAREAGIDRLTVRNPSLAGTHYQSGQTLLGAPIPQYVAKRRASKESARLPRIRRLCTTLPEFRFLAMPSAQCRGIIYKPCVRPVTSRHNRGVKQAIGR